MIFGFMTNPYRDQGYAVLGRSVRYLCAQGVRCVTEQTFATEPEVLQPGLLERGRWADCDLVISIGGDGSFLTAVQKIYSFHVPLVGINRGSLGFLNQIEVKDLEHDLDHLVRKDYRERHRMMLEVRLVAPDGTVKLDAVGLNDVVLSRGGNSRILPIHLHLDGHYVETVPADGMIVSTPVGSTGYAMAAGGAIVDPEMEILQITPICPHTLHNRSYVVHPNSEVILTVGKEYPHHPLVSVDGRHDAEMSVDDRVLIRRSTEPMRILQLHDRSFFNELPSKLNARGGYRT